MRHVLASIVLGVGLAAPSAWAELLASRSHLHVEWAADGRPVSTTVEIRNAGAHMVSITRAIVDCPCTSATFSRRRLEPGESTTLRLEITPGKRQGVLRQRLVVESTVGALTFSVEAAPSPSTGREKSTAPVANGASPDSET